MPKKEEDLSDEVIELHPKLGVNPRLCVCQWCGSEEGSSIMLLGIRNFVVECADCKRATFGKGLNSKCQNPSCKSHNVKVRELEENEKLPFGVCDSCMQKRRDTEKAVREGGVYFRCLRCKSEGAILKDHPLAIEIRRKNPAPAPIGIELPTCPVCEEPKKLDTCEPNGNGKS